nr:MAG TPA: hypothetical protein [Bacteriophage sp.]
MAEVTKDDILIPFVTSVFLGVISLDLPDFGDRLQS